MSVSLTLAKHAVTRTASWTTKTTAEYPVTISCSISPRCLLNSGRGFRLLLGQPPSEGFLAAIRQSPRRGLPEPRRRPVSSDASAEQGDVLKIVVAYCNGATPETIAAAHHSTEVSIRDALRQAGVILYDQARSSAEIRDQVRALHAQGLSMRAIARRYGVAHTTISRLLRDST